MSKAYTYNLHTRFDRLVRLDPEAVALRYPDGRVVTRGELADLAERQFERLAEYAVQRGQVVALFHDKEPHGYALMLACLKIGAACVNLDEHNPPERIASILATCHPVAVFGTHSLPEMTLEVSRAQGCEVRPLAVETLDSGGTARLQNVEANVDINMDIVGTDIAYIMFTSGSTGVPKGVAISHAQVLNLIDWAADEFNIDADDILTNVNPMYFDNSVFDFYASLFNGAALVPINAVTTRNPRALVDAVAATKCTLWFSVPSMLIYLTTMRVLDEKRWPSVRRIVFGGEGYPVPELKKLHSFFAGRARLVNVYGPTECTCICSANDVSAAMLSEELPLPPIGFLAPNFRGLLLEDDREIAAGETGELCLIGPNVGLGYYNDAEKTATAFVPNPLCSSHVERIYRTGDLMRRDVLTGELHFVGRKDHQFKHMGYRIEPGEIEAALNRLEGIERSVVIYKRHRTAYGEIIGFVATDDAAWNEERIKEALGPHLPAYMVPARIEIRKSLPSNANGKVDRKKLFEEA